MTRRYKVLKIDNPNNAGQSYAVIDRETDTAVVYFRIRHEARQHMTSLNHQEKRQ